MSAETQAADPNDFLVYNYDLVIGSGPELPGRLFVPPNYDPTKSYPLVMSYHGLGGKGRDNARQVQIAFNDRIYNKANDAAIEDFFLYAPQSGGGWWSGSQMQQSMNVVYQATLDYNIDPNRLYIVGNSSGGGGTWKVAAKYHDILAAAIPVAGAGYPITVESGQALAGEPLWAFHARNDTTVGATFSRRMVNQIRQVSSLPAWTFPNDSMTDFFDEENNLRYTDYATGGHGIGASRIFNNAPVYDWLFAQSSPGLPALEAGERMLFDIGGTSLFDQNKLFEIDEVGNYWNTLERGNERTLGVALAYAQTTAGKRTAVTMLIDDPFNRNDSKGVVDPASAYTAKAQSDSAWVGAGRHSAALAQRAEVRFTGLTPGAEYAIRFFASVAGNDGGLSYVARYTVGGVSQDLDASDNLQTMAVFPSVFADANGEIRFTVGVSPNGTTRHAHLSVVELEAVTLNSAVRADIDGDGDVDANDFNAFEVAHGLRLPQADLAIPEGTFDFLDYVFMLDAMNRNQ